MAPGEGRAWWPTISAVDDVRWLSQDEQALWQNFILAQQDLDRVISADLAGSALSHADYAVLVGLSGGDDAGVAIVPRTGIFR